MNLQPAYKLLDALGALEREIDTVGATEKVWDAFSAVLDAYSEIVRENIHLSTRTQGPDHGLASHSV